MHDQTADLSWRETDHGAVPVSDRFDDPYYSLSGGLDETRHVFLNGNNLADRWHAPLHIAELGFGTGLNLVVTWDAWQQGPKHPLHFTSFEAYPMDLDDMREALAAFPQISSFADRLVSIWQPNAGPVELAPNLTLEVIIGDARATLPDWSGKADAWFLDGFSPAKNPELWEPALITAVGEHTAQSGTAATYSAAGHVRQSLTDAGFEVTRVPGYGRKRHMTVARLRDAQ